MRLAAEHLPVRAVLQFAPQVGFHADDVKVAAVLLQAFALVQQQFEAGDVKAVQAFGEDYQAAPFMLARQFGKPTAHVFDRAEENRAIKAHHAQWRRASGVGLARLAVQRLEIHAAEHRVRDFLQIQYQREDDANVDGKIQAKQQGREEGGEQDGGFVAAGAQGELEARNIKEVPGGEHDDARHRWQRQVAGEAGRGDEGGCDQNGGDDLRQGRLRAAVVIDAAAVERAGDDVAGAAAADEVAQPLPEKFLIAVNALSGARGNGTGDGYGVDEAEQGDGNRRR